MTAKEVPLIAATVFGVVTLNLKSFRNPLLSQRDLDAGVLIFAIHQFADKNKNNN